MARTHKQSPARRTSLAILRPLVRFGYRRRSALAALLVLAGFLLIGLRLWRHIEGDVLFRPEYALGPHQIQITPPPPWIRADIKAEALGRGSLDGPLSIVDERLAERVAKVFLLHPWVARVESVTKHYPSRVSVELAYRRPVAMVEVPGGLFAVDDQSVLLPSDDFSPKEARRYPRIAGIDSQPLGPVGVAWGDAGVLEAVRIAAALSGVWNDLRLQSIRRVAASAGESSTPGITFELMTENGAAIPWGRAPGSEAATEPPLGEKLARLREQAAKYGSLDESARRNTIDLRFRMGARTASLEAVP